MQHIHRTKPAFYYYFITSSLALSEHRIQIIMCDDRGKKPALAHRLQHHSFTQKQSQCLSFSLFLAFTMYLAFYILFISSKLSRLNSCHKYTINQYSLARCNVFFRIYVQRMHEQSSNMGVDRNVECSSHIRNLKTMDVVEELSTSP